MAERKIITRRRKWTAEKAALLAEVEAEDGRVAMVARRHGLSESLLYNWRSVAKASVPTNEPETLEFRPIGVIGRPNEGVPNGVRLRVNGSVSETALSRALRAVTGAL